jgi:hypothetical protein
MAALGDLSATNVTVREIEALLAKVAKGGFDPPELLDVQVHKLSGTLPLIAVR